MILSDHICASTMARLHDKMRNTNEAHLPHVYGIPLGVEPGRPQTQNLLHQDELLCGGSAHAAHLRVWKKKSVTSCSGSPGAWPMCRFLFATSAEKYRQPSRYSAVIDAINARLREYAEGQGRVSYVDCNVVLLESSSKVRYPAVSLASTFMGAGLAHPAMPMGKLDTRSTPGLNSIYIVPC